MSKMQNATMVVCLPFGRPKSARLAAKKALLEQQQAAMDLIEGFVGDIPRVDVHEVSSSPSSSSNERRTYTKCSDDRSPGLKNRKRRSNNTIKELYSSPVKKARSSSGFKTVEESLQCLESFDDLESPLSPPDSQSLSPPDSSSPTSDSVSNEEKDSSLNSSHLSAHSSRPPLVEVPCLFESLKEFDALAATLGFYSGEDEIEYTGGFSPYEEDIFLFRRTREVKFHPLLSLCNQPQVTPFMRGVLVDWLSKLTVHFKFCQETLFLTVNIIDRFLLTTPVSRDCFQLLGITAFLIAAKQEEVTPPDQEELIRLCCNAFSSYQIKSLELLVLNRLHFDLFVPTSQYFFEHFCATRLRKAYVIGCSKEYVKLTRALGRHMLVQCLQSYTLSQHLPSLLACSVLELAHTFLHFSKPAESRHTRLYSRHVLDKCIQHVKVHTIDQISEEEMPAICEKYMTLYQK